MLGIGVAEGDRLVGELDARGSTVREVEDIAATRVIVVDLILAAGGAVEDEGGTARIGNIAGAGVELVGESLRAVCTARDRAAARAERDVQSSDAADQADARIRTRADADILQCRVDIVDVDLRQLHRGGAAVLLLMSDCCEVFIAAVKRKVAGLGCRHCTRAADVELAGIDIGIGRLRLEIAIVNAVNDVLTRQRAGDTRVARGEVNLDGSCRALLVDGELAVLVAVDLNGEDVLLIGEDDVVSGEHAGIAAAEHDGVLRFERGIVDFAADHVRASAPLLP